jgi:hypothetical protein
MEKKAGLSFDEDNAAKDPVFVVTFRQERGV